MALSHWLTVSIKEISADFKILWSSEKKNFKAASHNWTSWWCGYATTNSVVLPQESLKASLAPFTFNILLKYYLLFQKYFHTTY